MNALWYSNNPRCPSQENNFTLKVTLHAWSGAAARRWVIPTKKNSQKGVLKHSLFRSSKGLVLLGRTWILKTSLFPGVVVLKPRVRRGCVLALVGKWDGDGRPKIRPIAQGPQFNQSINQNLTTNHTNEMSWSPQDTTNHARLTSQPKIKHEKITQMRWWWSFQGWSIHLSMFQNLCCCLKSLLQMLRHPNIHPTLSSHPACVGEKGIKVGNWVPWDGRRQSHNFFLQIHICNLDKYNQPFGQIKCYDLKGIEVGSWVSWEGRRSFERAGVLGLANTGYNMTFTDQANLV